MSPVTSRRWASAIRAVTLGVLLATTAAGKPKAPPRVPAPSATTDKPRAAASPAPVESRDSATQADATADKGPSPPAKATSSSGASVVKTEEGKEGVKTYQFGAVEVEGRLRSPQLIYFLRRVRAEFLAGDLGHRSFLPELSETARNATFR